MLSLSRTWQFVPNAYLVPHFKLPCHSLSLIHLLMRPFHHSRLRFRLIYHTLSLIPVQSPSFACATPISGPITIQFKPAYSVMHQGPLEYLKKVLQAFLSTLTPIPTQNGPLSHLNHHFLQTIPTCILQTAPTFNTVGRILTQITTHSDPRYQAFPLTPSTSPTYPATHSDTKYTSHPYTSSLPNRSLLKTTLSFVHIPLLMTIRTTSYSCSVQYVLQPNLLEFYSWIFILPFPYSSSYKIIPPLRCTATNRGAAASLSKSHVRFTKHFADYYVESSNVGVFMNIQRWS